MAVYSNGREGREGGREGWREGGREGWREVRRGAIVYSASWEICVIHTCAHVYRGYIYRWLGVVVVFVCPWTHSSIPVHDYKLPSCVTLKT